MTIVDFHDNQHMNKSQIAREVGVSEKTVRNYLKKWDQKVPVESIVGRGRKRKIGQNEARTMANILKETPNSSSTQIAVELGKRGVNVTRRCVSKNLVDLDYKYAVPRVVPLLTDRHKIQRVEWCRKYIDFDWSKVYFSDETYVEIHGTRNCRWFKKGHRPIEPRPKFSFKVLFWASISTKTKSPLVSSDVKMNSQGYCCILETHFLPFLTKTRTKRFFFQQDNATAHTSKYTKEFLSKKSIKTIDWPANSPDLNPIENIWSILKRSVSMRSPNNKNDLIGYTEDEWSKIPIETIARTIESMKTRILQVLKRNGGKCDY